MIQVSAKKELLQRGARHSGLVTQLAEASNSTHLPSGEQYEAVANAFRVPELMNGEDERPVPGSFRCGLRQ